MDDGHTRQRRGNAAEVGRPVLEDKGQEVERLANL